MLGDLTVVELWADIPLEKRRGTKEEWIGKGKNRCAAACKFDVGNEDLYWQCRKRVLLPGEKFCWSHGGKAKPKVPVLPKTRRTYVVRVIEEQLRTRSFDVKVEATSQHQAIETALCLDSSQKEWGEWSKPRIKRSNAYLVLGD